MQVWLNGTFVDRDQARVSVFDAGFQHAVGLFETMNVRNGRAFRAHAHMRRLIDSARALLLSERLHEDPLVTAVAHAIEANALDEARVRLTITGGDLNLLQSSGVGPQDPTILIVAQPPTVYPDTFFSAGTVVRIADGRLNPLWPLEGHKTLAYWGRIQALQQAAAAGASEALWFSVSNHLACGSVSNVFLLEDGRLLTPPARGEEEPGALPSPVLPGITRAAVLEIAPGLGLEPERRLLGIEDVLGADEVFLTNSSWGVLPVVGVERETISGGVPGEVTRQIRAAWLGLVDAETS